MPQFLDPGAFVWLAAALPAITILYFLKLRRQEEVISSTLLWRRSVHDLRVNAPFQTLRRNLLLLLQLIIAALIIAALARPFTKLSHAAGRQAALIIDLSASMATKDEKDGKTRFAAAKEEALKIIDNLGVGGATGAGNDELCVIAAAGRPRVLCGLTADKDKLRRVVMNLKAPLQTKTNMTAALEMAVAVTGVGRNLARMDKGEEIKRDGSTGGMADEALVGLEDKSVRVKANVIILSDGAFAKLPLQLADKLSGQAEGDAPGVGQGSRYIPFGKAGGETNNVALVSVDLRTTDDLSRRQLFVRVENMSRKERTAKVEVTLAGVFIDRKDISIPGKTMVKQGDADAFASPGQVGVVFALAPEATGLLEVKLLIDDNLALDNTVYAVIQPPEPISVLLVTTGNYPLAQALSADRKNVVFAEIDPSNYPAKGSPKQKNGKPWELIIYDRWAPKIVPTGATFFIDAVPPLPGIKEDTANSPLLGPQMVYWSRTHPLTRNLTLLDERIVQRAKRLILSGGWATVIEGEGIHLAKPADLNDDAKLAAAPILDAPLLGCLITEERRVGVLAFDFFQTDIPHRITFPLFIKNITHWLARPGGMQRAIMYATGETLRVPLVGKVGEVTVTTPSGKKVRPTVYGSEARGIYFSDTYQTGVYQVQVAGQPKRPFAFNLLSSAESDNARAESITIGSETLEAKRGTTKQNTDLWPYVILAALAFLLGEWYVYNRRILG